LSVWDMVSGQEKVLKTEGDAFGVSFSPDGKLLASGSYADDVQIWDVATGKVVIQISGGGRGKLEVVAFSPDGKILATASSNRTEGHSDGMVRLWDVSTGNLRFELGNRSNTLAGVAFSPDGKTFASGGADTSVRLWDTTSGELLTKLNGHPAAVVSVAFSPDGNRLASVDIGKDNQVRLWDVSSGQSIRTINGCARQDYANQGKVYFSPDGKWLASACEGKGVMVWDAVNGQVNQLYQAYMSGVYDIAFSPDSHTLAGGYSSNWTPSASSDILLWNLDTKVVSSRLTGHLYLVNSVAFNPKGTQLASGGTDGTVRLWDLVTGDSVIILEGYPMPKDTGMQISGIELDKISVSSVAYSPDGSVLAVGSGMMMPGFLELYDTTTGSLHGSICKYPCERMEVSDISFSPDGMLLATEEGDGVIRLRDASNGQVRRQFSDTHSLGKVAFSPDGKILAATEYWSAAEGNSMTEEDARGGVHFWDVKTGERMDLLDVGVEPVTSIAFSADGKLLAIGHYGSVVVWDMAARTTAAQVDCGEYPVIGFSPDGSLLAIGNENGVINLWGVPEQ
jgi:WD40 repeat protein